MGQFFRLHEELPPARCAGGMAVTGRAKKIPPGPKARRSNIPRRNTRMHRKAPENKWSVSSWAGAYASRPRGRTRMRERSYPPDGEALAERIRSFVHDKFQEITLPRFIRSVQVHSFDFGTTAPDLEIKDLCEPFADFYEEDDDDA